MLDKKNTYRAWGMGSLPVGQRSCLSESSTFELSLLVYSFRHPNFNFVIVSVCGNTMCYLNYREAEVQVLKRT